MTLFSPHSMSFSLRTLGITIASAVVIIAANASIYAHATNTGEHMSRQEAQSNGNPVHIVVHQII
jgi:hypothetical protein